MENTVVMLMARGRLDQVQSYLNVLMKHFVAVQYPASYAFHGSLPCARYVGKSAPGEGDRKM
jgi:hypothetical protein